MHESFSSLLSNKRLNFLAYSPQMAHLAKALLLRWRDEHSSNRAISERDKDIVGWEKWWDSQFISPKNAVVSAFHKMSSGL